MKKITCDNLGYTLIELMSVVAMLAILLTVGVPQLNVYFQGNRMVSNTNDLVSALQIARSEAIKQGARATVCKSSNANATPPSCNTGASWKDGWIVFIDSDGIVGNYSAANDGALLRVYNGVSGKDVTVTPQDVSIADFVSFTSRGVPKTSAGASQSGVFSICDDRGLKNSAGNVIARGVELSASGRVRSTNVATKIVSCP